MLFHLLSEVAEQVRAREVTERGFFSIYEAVKAIERHPEKSFSVTCQVNDEFGRTPVISYRYADAAEPDPEEPAPIT